MEMCFIPPLEMLDQAGNYHIQLMLPELTRYPEYCAKMKKWHNEGKYIILDNGANEDAQVANGKLCQLGMQYKVNEIVLPDVMGNFNATLRASQEYIKDYIHNYPCNYGFVLHGANLAEVMYNYEFLREQTIFELISVIYLPRMLSTEDAPYTRVEAAKAISLHREKIIHFLGGSTWRTDEIRNLEGGVKGRHVRSMDTSAPYFYALENKYVEENAGIKRGRGYFEAPMDLGQRKIALENCRTMELWTR